jgi:hypothetical protein
MNKIAIDVGSGLTKWKTATGDGCFPSAVGSHEINPQSFQVEDYSSDLVYLPKSERPYLVGDSADALLEDHERKNTLKRDWAQTTEYRALLYKAIADAFPDGCGRKLALCIGLPQAYFEDHRESIKTKIARDHSFRVGDQTYNFSIPEDRFFVIPQSMSIFFEYVAEVDEAALSEDVCVIDVGTFTTGYSMVNSGKFNARKSGGLELGISNFRDDLRRHIKRIHKLDLPKAAVTKALVRGKLKVGNKFVKLASVIPDIADPLMDELIEKLTDVWGDSSQTATVLVGGGGARYVHTSLKRQWPHLRIMGGEDGCAMVIVKGYYGYLESS